MRGMNLLRHFYCRQGYLSGLAQVQRYHDRVRLARPDVDDFHALVYCSVFPLQTTTKFPLIHFCSLETRLLYW